MTMFIRRYSGAVFISASVLVGSCAAATISEKISANQARSIADQSVASAGFDSAKHGGVPWTLVQLHENPENRCHEHLMTEPSLMNDLKEMRNVLTDRSYYLVMYEPSNEVIFGNRVCIFIDAKSGEILSKELW